MAIGWTLAALAGLWGAAGLRAYWRRDLTDSAYPSPDAAEREIDDLLHAYPESARAEEIGRSREGRSIRALWIQGKPASATPKPRLLVTGHLHAVEYIGAYVARALARRALEQLGRDRDVTALLDAADLCVVPQLNPDGAHRVWRAGGFVSLGGARFTANGVDPNRNFPRPEDASHGLWNSGRNRPGSPYHRGAHPLSEPECAALARLCAREQFCGALNFHSFGGVVYLPAVDDEAARRAYAVFSGAFQSRQRWCRYRPVPEPMDGIAGQLDAFLWSAFGTPSVTIEVSRLRLGALLPGRLGNLFWIANPSDPVRWADNDAPAGLYALAELLHRTGGAPLAASLPELAAGLRD